MSMSLSSPSSSPLLVSQLTPDVEPLKLATDADSASREASLDPGKESPVTEAPIVMLSLEDMAEDRVGIGTAPSPRNDDIAMPPDKAHFPAAEADGLSMFGRLANLAREHVDYVRDGYRSDSALGNRMIGGLDAPLPQQVFGSIGKVAVIVIGGVVRATGLAKLAKWGVECTFAFARWVVRGCISCAQSLGRIVADEVLKKATDQRNVVRGALDKTVENVRKAACDPKLNTETRRLAQISNACVEGRLGNELGKILREAVDDEGFKVQIDAAARTVRKRVVTQAVGASKPYVYASAAAAAVGLGASLYYGNTTQVASGMVVAVGSAVIGTASYYALGGGQGTSLFSRLNPVNWLFPIPEDDGGPAPQSAPVMPASRPAGSELMAQARGIQEMIVRAAALQD